MLPRFADFHGDIGLRIAVDAVELRDSYEAPIAVERTKCSVVAAVGGCQQLKEDVGGWWRTHEPPVQIERIRPRDGIGNQRPIFRCQLPNDDLAPVSEHEARRLAPALRFVRTRDSHVAVPPPDAQCGSVVAVATEAYDLVLPRQQSTKHANGVTHLLVPTVASEAAVMLADILPTSFEVVALNGMVQPGDVMAIVGVGPIGLAAALTARLFSPRHVVVIDVADARLEAAKAFGVLTSR